MFLFCLAGGKQGKALTAEEEARRCDMTLSYDAAFVKAVNASLQQVLSVLIATNA